MIASREPAHWDGPPIRLCFLESLEVSPGTAGGHVSPPNVWASVPAFPRHLDAVFPSQQLALGVKRILDIVGGCFGLLLSLPILAVAAVAIRRADGGPVFFRQERCGKDGSTFTMWKLRSMVPDAEKHLVEVLDRNEMEGPVYKRSDDPRITPVGRKLRRFSLDELPQFWNVLKGEMSLVGPRPALPAEVASYSAVHRRRLSVKPGLTCTWQVSGRNRIDFDEWMRLDLEYIDRWTIGHDLVLIARTIPAVLGGDGAS